MDVPKQKKTLHAFLVGEDAKISKEGVMKAGAVLTAVALAVGLNAQKTEAFTGSSSVHSNAVNWGEGAAQHSHHSSHASY